jgi:hypothetical protein
MSEALAFELKPVARLAAVARGATALVKRLCVAYGARAVVRSDVWTQLARVACAAERPDPCNASVALTALKLSWKSF